MIKMLINPFEKLQTKTLFILGFCGLILGSTLAYLCNARFNGLLSIQFHQDIKFSDPLVDNLINIGSLTVFLFLAGWLINKKTRFVDILNTVMLSRILFYLLVLLNASGSVERITNQILDSIKQSGATTSPDLDTVDLMLLIVFSILAILTLIWKVIILYNGYKVASNARGTRAVILFILAFILAEVCAKSFSALTLTL